MQKNKQTNKQRQQQATTAQLYLSWDTLEFDQRGGVTKNQPMTVLVLLSESLGLQQILLFITN